MGPFVVIGVLALELAVSVPQKPVQLERPAKRSVFSRLGRAARRIGALEPAAAMRLSSWGIPDRGNPGPQANVTGSRQSAFKQQ